MAPFRSRRRRLSRRSGWGRSEPHRRSAAGAKRRLSSRERRRTPAGGTAGYSRPNPSDAAAGRLAALLIGGAIRQARRSERARTCSIGAIVRERLWVPRSARQRVVYATDTVMPYRATSANGVASVAVVSELMLKDDKVRIIDERR